MRLKLANARFVVFALAITAFSARTVAAQFEARVRWPLVDIIVRGDSSGAFELLTAPNLLSKQGTGPQTALHRLVLPPIDALQWATLMRRLVDSLAELPPSQTPMLLNPALKETADTGAIQLGFLRERGLPPFRFMVAGSRPERAWQVAVTAREIRELLDAVVEIAGVAAVPERRAARMLRAEERAGCPIPNPDGDVTQSVDEKPTLLSRALQYPRLAYPRTGRVWLQFAIDSTGRVESGSECVLLTDHAFFTSAVIEALPEFLYQPGRFQGQAIRVWAFSEFRFQIRQP